MTGHGNQMIVRKALEGVWSTNGKVAPEEVYAADFVSHQHSHPTVTDVHGLEALNAFVNEFHRAFPDFRDTVDRQICEGDMVATQFTSSGTHTGELMGVPATGKRIEWMGIELARVEQGKIAENWVSWDMFGMLQQLGVATLPA